MWRLFLREVRFHAPSASMVTLMAVFAPELLSEQGWRRGEDLLLAALMVSFLFAVFLGAEMVASERRTGTREFLATLPIPRWYPEAAKFTAGVALTVPAPAGLLAGALWTHGWQWIPRWAPRAELTWEPFATAWMMEAVGAAAAGLVFGMVGGFRSRSSLAAGLIGLVLALIGLPIAVFGAPWLFWSLSRLIRFAQDQPLGWRLTEAIGLFWLATTVAIDRATRGRASWRGVIWWPTLSAAVALAVVVQVGHGWMAPRPMPSDASIYSLGVTGDGRTVHLLADTARESRPRYLWRALHGVFRLDVSTRRLDAGRPVGLTTNYPTILRQPFELVLPRGNPFWTSSAWRDFSNLYLDLRSPLTPVTPWEAAFSALPEVHSPATEARATWPWNRVAQVHDFPQGRLLIDTRCDTELPGPRRSLVVLRTELGATLPVRTPPGFVACDARIIESLGSSGGRHCERHRSSSDYYRWIPNLCALAPFDAPAGTETVIAASEDAQFVLLEAGPPSPAARGLELVLQGASPSNRRTIPHSGLPNRRDFLLGSAPDVLMVTSGAHATTVELHRIDTGQVQSLTLGDAAQDRGQAWLCRHRRTPYRVVGIHGRSELIVYDTRTREIRVLRAPDVARPSDAELLGDSMYWVQGQREVWRTHLPSGRHERLYPH